MQIVRFHDVGNQEVDLPNRSLTSPTPHPEPVRFLLGLGDREAISTDSRISKAIVHAELCARDACRKDSSISAMGRKRETPTAR